MGIKEDQVNKAQALLSGRQEKIKQLTENAQYMMELVRKLQGIKPTTKKVVINGVSCTVAFNTADHKNITLIFADENEGKKFVNSL